MKNLNKIFALVVIMFAFASVSFGQPTTAVTESATATCNIITPLTLTNNVDLAFGNIAAGTSTGTVALSAATPAVRTESGGVTLPATTGTVTAAEFTLTGEANYAYTITLPSNGDVTITDGSNPMNVNDFVDSSTGTIPAGGSETFYVGATLEVGVSQTAGSYTGTFDVTVDYE